MKLIIFTRKYIFYKIFLQIILNRSVGSQVMTGKKSEPQLSMGKSSRDKELKLGMFPSMMSKQATRISLPHPKI
jgi:hypothetical protein